MVVAPPGKTSLRIQSSQSSHSPLCAPRAAVGFGAGYDDAALGEFQFDLERRAQGAGFGESAIALCGERRCRRGRRLRERGVIAYGRMGHFEKL